MKNCCTQEQQIQANCEIQKARMREENKWKFDSHNKMDEKVYFLSSVYENNNNKVGKKWVSIVSFV